MDSVVFMNEGTTYSAILTEIECTDASHCIVAGVWSNQQSFIRASDDGGKSWRTTWADTLLVADTGGIVRVAKRVLDLASFRDGQVLAALDSGIMLRSTDAGLTWSEARLEAPGSIDALSTFGSSEALVVQDTTIWYSADAGRSWEKTRARHPLLSDGYDTGDIAAASRNDWLFSLGRRRGSLLATTTDGGMTWSDEPPILGKGLRSLYLEANGVGWAAGDQGTRYDDVREIVMRTTDHGASWHYVLDTLPIGRISLGLKTLCSWQGAVLLTGGSHGVVWRSVDRGSSWERISEGLSEATDNAFYDIAVSQDDTYWGVLNTGAVVRYSSSVRPAAALPNEQDRLSGLTMTSDGSFVRIAARTPVVVELSISDMLGRTSVRRRERVGTSVLEVPLDGLPAGAVVVTARGEGVVRSTVVVHQPE